MAHSWKKQFTKIRKGSVFSKWWTNDCEEHKTCKIAVFLRTAVTHTWIRASNKTKKDKELQIVLFVLICIVIKKRVNKVVEYSYSEMPFSHFSSQSVDRKVLPNLQNPRSWIVCERFPSKEVVNIFAPVNWFAVEFILSIRNQIL